MSELGGNESPVHDVNALVQIEENVEMNQITPNLQAGVSEDLTNEDIENVPEVGKKFMSYDEAFEFYMQYAYKVGFPVRKRNTKKGLDGVLTNATFACSREGKRVSSTRCSLKPHPTIQTGCKAKITICSDVNGTWRITKLHLEHNHRTSPSKSRLYRCNRQLNDQVKRKLEVNDIAGIPLHKSFNSAVVEAGGYEELAYIEKDCRNYIDKVRRLRLGEEDAAAIQAYFCKMQSNCPGFFFNVDLDDESRLRNVFWADKRSRMAYSEFGDVVTFDTTYLTNRYDMPFAPFVGVNHHGQSTLLGCGLISNENTETFTWLFRTWLQCMDGVAPPAIITDQDRAMQNAIQIVFQNSKHRWCLWHILKKLPEKFGYHAEKGHILHTVHEVVYESQIPEEFERGWASMLDVHSLHEHDWLSGLYRERARWVPCYLRTSFWAGMSTTQRSESMNAFFDGYVHSKTSLKQFVEQYERALKCKVEKEFNADFKSYSQMIPCATTFGFERQFQDTYTIEKFKEFQCELTGKVYCDFVSTEEDAMGTTYIVREHMPEFRKRKDSKVRYDIATSDIVCSCHLFEFRGIICRHAISVLIRNEVDLLPERYILRRWRRDVIRAYTRLKINYDGWISTPAQIRYDKMAKSFEKMANLVADDEARTEEFIEWIESRMNNLNVGTSRSICGSARPSNDGILDQTLRVQILDPNPTKSKGAPRKLRKKGPLETKTKKSKVPSRSNKGKNSTSNKETESTSITQPAQEQNFQVQEQNFQVFAPISYTHQLMGAQLQPFGGAYGVNYINQQGMPTYLHERHPGLGNWE